MACGFEKLKPEPGAKQSQALGLALAWPIPHGLAWPLAFRPSQPITSAASYLERITMCIANGWDIRMEAAHIMGLLCNSRTALIIGLVFVRHSHVLYIHHIGYKGPGSYSWIHLLSRVVCFFPLLNERFEERG